MPIHNNYAKPSIKYLQSTMLRTSFKLVLVPLSYRWEMRLREVKWLLQYYVVRKWGARIKIQVSRRPKSIYFTELFIPEGIKSKLLTLAFRTLWFGSKLLPVTADFHPPYTFVKVLLFSAYSLCFLFCLPLLILYSLCYLSHILLEV